MKAVSPAERIVSVVFPQAWHTLSVVCQRNHWFVFLVLQEPMEVQLHCVIKKGFSWRGKKKNFPYKRLWRSTSEIFLWNIQTIFLNVYQKFWYNACLCLPFQSSRSMWRQYSPWLEISWMWSFPSQNSACRSPKPSLYSVHLRLKLTFPSCRRWNTVHPPPGPKNGSLISSNIH